ncbi:ABC-type nitrate/sulfonate/bicarbonate transport system, ATPase component [Clostridium cavendishii DSM 21758]|uniref:ABC-type nitrate/sulfonate/bicarbonate transport system, ATPase component n=1 Tax=Clostridium cavendishii DSM 21758 TaxID=1121302 RepID=A0A1M6I9P4_9CLOT|nr:ABC transporter ATP-binding protein [Clostridium cavendishii]SHJ31106.1 ABC-type nitrate/sulfonate/bicarbonate transport system, ATPase component [Clostridium cavendishii DSM 21758]
MNSYQNKILIKDLDKSFKNLKVLKDINLEVNEGELVSLLGPSGSGKSTIFNIIAGTMEKDSGLLEVNGDISYMYQKDMMLPWKTIMNNIAMPLVLKGKHKKEAKALVLESIEEFGLAGFEDKYPSQLSGGMLQRANFYRTYLTSSDIMLLDEPFGALDSITRTKMQRWLLNLRKKVNSTILFITHDIDEAIILSDRIYIISKKPATVLENIKVTLPHNNRQEALTTEEFLKIKRNILEVMKEEI